MRKNDQFVLLSSETVYFVSEAFCVENFRLNLRCRRVHQRDAFDAPRVHLTGARFLESAQSLGSNSFSLAPSIIDRIRHHDNSEIRDYA